MGFALAIAAAAAGGRVTLISGPTSLRPPPAAKFVRVTTAAEMHREVELAPADADVLIMAAAVADFRPEFTSDRKLKKKADQEIMDIRLVRNPDILASIDRPNLLKIGFAAETEDHLENAARKLAAKHLSIIVANDAEATIGAAESTATILTSDGDVKPLPRMSKAKLATEIIAAASELLDHENRLPR
jgi:phosphopantothenoylcysteine decarboxylase/phosphopantothenate--cysteine ligase